MGLACIWRKREKVEARGPRLELIGFAGTEVGGGTSVDAEVISKHNSLVVRRKDLRLT